MFPLIAPLVFTSATLIPTDVPVTTAPAVFVLVNVLVAVVVAVQAVQLVQGAFAVHGPLVHPLHVESGQPLPFHHEVHGPDVHGPEEKAPKPPPKGPPLPGAKPGPAPFDPGPPLDQEPDPDQEVRREPVKLASGAAVMVVPDEAQRDAMR